MNLISDCTKPTCIIVDIDGVLCDSSKRFQLIDLDAKKNEEYLKFYQSLQLYNSTTDGDVPIELGFNLLKSFISQFNPDLICYLTARGIPGKVLTMKWLNANGLLLSKKEKLIMRPESGKYSTKSYMKNNHDFEYKKEQAARLLKKYNIILAIDDSLPNCKAFNELGIPTLYFTLPIIGNLHV